MTQAPGIPDEIELPEPDTCPGCRVAPGTPHQDQCDHARCPGCGEQLLFHDCGDSTRPAMWHGWHPEDETAHRLGWYYVHPSPGKPIVPDGTMVRARCTWDPHGQRYMMPTTTQDLSVRWESGVDYARIAPRGTRNPGSPVGLEIMGRRILHQEGGQ